MSDLVIVCLPGPPEGKGRPRASVRDGRVHMRTPNSTRSYEDALRWVGAQAMGGRPPMAGPLRVEIRADMPIPQSMSKAKRAKAISGELRPETKPDADNLAKMIDGLNSIVWGDDKQIASLTVEKFYSERPALTITVSTV